MESQVLAMHNSQSAHDGTVTEPSPAKAIRVDTLKWSLLHRIARDNALGLTPPWRDVRLVISIACLVYGPIVLAAIWGTVPLTTATADVRLPLFYDLNTAWMCIASIPTLAMLVIRDQAVLNEALKQVQDDGVLRPNEATVSEFPGEATSLFSQLNIVGQAMATVVGVAVALANYHAMSDPHLGAWGAHNGVMLPAGYALLVAIAVMYWLVTFFVVRGMGMILCIRRLATECDLDMVPLHPDKCGGLRPMGQMGLRNQYALSVIGVNVFLLAWVTLKFLPHTPTILALVTVGTLAYLILGPLIFLMPLLPFRDGMMKAKRDLLQPIARRLRVELATIERHLDGGTVTREQEEFVDRLQKLGAMVDSLPVWPFDLQTLRKFLTAYVLPILGAVLIPLGQGALNGIIQRLSSG